MPWLRMDDGFTTNPKVMGLSLAGKVLWMYSLGYCAHELTDGLILERVIPALAGLAGVPDAAEISEELVSAGLWEIDPHGFRVHDYLVYNPSRADVLAEREKAKARMSFARSSPEVRPNLIDPVPGPVPGPGSIPGSEGSIAVAHAPAREKKPKDDSPKKETHGAHMAAIADESGTPLNTMPPTAVACLAKQAIEAVKVGWSVDDIHTIARIWRLEHSGYSFSGPVMLRHGAKILANKDSPRASPNGYHANGNGSHPVKPRNAPTDFSDVPMPAPGETLKYKGMTVYNVDPPRGTNAHQA